jgi:ABC-type lipoprotein release transport system permease subunit
MAIWMRPFWWLIKEHGASLVEPEIRTVTGTTMENAMLLRGVTLETYRRVEPFRVIAGRPLEPGDPSRRVMVGERLAQERQAYPGGVLTIRGRDFQVQAVFSTGTYSDFEAWIALEDAQELLGWEGEVSIFIVPAGEGLRAGDILPEASVAVQMGESGTNLVAEFRQFFDLLGLIAVTLGISAAVILANALWRLAWQHRHDLAVLQAVGFTRRALCVYLGGQGAAITLVGFFLGILEGALVEAFTRFQAAEITIQPGLDGRTILLNFAFALGVLALSTALPVAWLARLNLTSLLHVE